MPAAKARHAKVKFLPLVKSRWPDFEKLFGERGACGGCWCMYWRLRHSEYEQRKGARNKQAMKKLVERGTVPGLLAYEGDKPVAWCAVAPREQYVRLETSRVLKKLDDQPVWSIVCFFIEKGHRKRGLTVQFLNAAKEYVREQGGKILEGYPVEPKKDRIPEVFAFTGLASAFCQAGFAECARRSEARPVMRCALS